MKRTIYIPDDLDRRLTIYVRRQPGRTVSSIIQEALENFVGRQDPRRILRLAGAVRKASGPVARRQAEDATIARER